MRLMKAASSPLEYADTAAGWAAWAGARVAAASGEVWQSATASAAAPPTSSRPHRTVVSLADPIPEIIGTNRPSLEVVARREAAPRRGVVDCRREPRGRHRTPPRSRRRPDQQGE